MASTPNSLTTGPIWKRMTIFALPILLGNIFQQLYNTFDAWVVGNYLGDASLAAVSSSGSLIFMIVSFLSGVSMGAGVIIARYYGAKDYKQLSEAIHTNVAYGLVSGLALTLIGTLLSPVLLNWMGTPKDVMPESVSYMQWYFAGGIFMSMYNVFVGILHAVGDSKHPLIYLIVSSMINVLLDLLFVGIFGWGVGSAAVATTISQAVSATLCFIQLIRSKNQPHRLYIRRIRFHWSSLKEIFRHGLPAGVQNSVISIANVVVQSNINSFGTAAMAGCGSYSKLEGFAFLPITCFTQALATFVGQNLGAGKLDRVKKGVRFGIFCCVILAEIVGLVFWLFAPELISIFNDAPDVVLYGSSHMRTTCLFFCLLAFSHCIASILRGAGRSTVPMLVMLVCWCLIRVTYISIAVKYVNELTTVSWAYPITWTCSSIAFLVYYLKADWIHAFEKADLRKKATLKH